MQTRASRVTRLSKEYAAISVMFVAAVLILGLPFAFRYVRNEPLLFTSEPYYNLRIAETIQKTGMPSKDLFLFDERPYIPNLYHIALASLMLFSGPIYASIFFPLALGVCSLLLFNRIMRLFGVSFDYRALALVILLISPTYITTFTRSSPLVFAVFLNLLGFYLISMDSKLFRLAAVGIFALIPFVGLTDALVTVIVCLSLFLSDRKRYLLAGVSSMLVLSTSLIWMLVTHASLRNSVPALALQPLSEYFSNLGGLYGFGAFSMLLALVGLLFVWQNERRSISIYVMAMCIALLTLPDIKLSIYLTFFVALLGGIGFIRLYRMKWQLKEIKFLSLLLLACGLLFSGTLSIGSLASSGPNEQLVASLQWLHGMDTKVVFTHHTRAAWVQAIAGKKVLLDEHDRYDLQSRLTYNDSQTLFYSRNLQKTKSLFNSYNITHILIDSKMRHGLVWNKEEEGLLFLFRNNETFKKIYDEEEVEIWLILSSGEKATS
jgi:hypothetical protein